METESSLSRLQVAVVTILSQFNPFHAPATQFQLPRVCIPQVSPRTLYTSLRYIYVLLASSPPTHTNYYYYYYYYYLQLGFHPVAVNKLHVYFLIRSPEKCLVSSTDLYAPHCVLFSIPRYLVRLRPKCSPQYPILKHPRPTFIA
jgi:hypothetical protein